MASDLSRIPEEFRELAQRRLESGTFASADDIVCEALRLWAQQEALIDENLEELRSQIADGFRSAEAGRLRDGEEAVADVRKRIDKRLAGGE